LIAPDGGLFTGQSALVSLSSAPPREAVLRSRVALHVAFRDSGPDYPRVLMGFIAHGRQTLLDAGHYQRAWNVFEQAGRVGRRPPLDPALVELGQVLTGKLPVVMEADSKDEIHRALDFAQEFHLRPILYGGRDAWKAAERIKRQKVPVLLRLTMTDRPQQPEGRRRGGPVRPGPGLAAEPESAEQPGVPKRVEEDRKQKLQEELRNAAVLHQQGIPFGLCTQGQPGDKPAEKFKDNLRKIINEGGLSPEAALKALTIDAARILGVDKQLGTLSVGKAAHLVVTDGDFHDAKTRVRYAFADGIRFAYDVISRSPGAPMSSLCPSCPRFGCAM
jgi:hypothetical protein